MKKLVASLALTASLSTMLLVPAFGESAAPGPHTTHGYGTYGATTAPYGTTTTAPYGTTTTTPGAYRTGISTAPGVTTPGVTAYDATRANAVRARAADTTPYRNNWGWLGLLGLIGLAGLRGRDRERT